MTMSPTTRDVGHSEVPTRSTLRTDLSNRVAIIWRRGKAKVYRLFGNRPPETHIPHESPCRLPYEIVEVIISHLIYHHDTLKACSLTCRSWYFAAVPHIHHTLALGDKRPGKPHDKLKPLSKVHELGLTPLVKKITVRQWLSCHWFTPQAFSPRDLRCFSAFTNVQTLRLEQMDISSFIPGIERYFEHFSPTLRSITLWDPCCTPRQLLYFISLFSNLDSIGIWGISARPPKTTIPDTELVQFSVPKLRGELGLSGPHWTETWTHLIASCGGLRFNCLNLYDVGGFAPALFEACAETLETLRFSPVDNSVRFRSLSFPGFNLSRLKNLRSLHIGGWTVNFLSTSARHTTLMEIFSTIVSPVFSELALILGNESLTYLPSDIMLFETLRAMSEVKPFKLVFFLVVPNRLLGEARGKVAEALDSAAAKGLLGFLDSPPTIRIA